jgi:hypothetical protein
MTGTIFFRVECSDRPGAGERRPVGRTSWFAGRLRAGRRRAEARRQPERPAPHYYV